MTNVRVQRSFASAWLALLAFGCSAQSESSAPLPSALEPLPLARELARPEPSLVRALSRSRFEASGSAASSPRGATDPFVRLPPTAESRIDFRAGERAASLARVRSLGAAPAPLELREGVATYRKAVEGADALWLLRGNALEQLLVVRDAPARLSFAWELCRAEGLQEPRAVPEAGLLASDARGTDRLRIPPPFALDARGQRRELGMEYRPGAGTCGEVTFTLDARGLEVPLLVDPALEAVLWTDRTDPEQKPPGRYSHGLAYDPVRDKTVLFGGSDNGPAPFFDDLWEWDGAVWRDVTPSAGPGGRLYHDLVYSSAHGGAVMIGGVTDYDSTTAHNDVWVWDGAWTKLEPGGATLPPLLGHALAFDAERERVVLYGGYGEDRNERVWELGAAGFVDRGTFAISPGSIDMFAMAYDATGKATLVFGGSTPAGYSDDPFAPRTDAAHLWNGAGWTRLETPRPSPRSGMASAFDSKRGRIVLFGGTSGEVYDDETWEYAAGSFEQREPLRRPPARESARLAYDAGRERVVLFGGFGDSDGSDTWTYAHFGNTCRDEADCDGEACVDGVCCEDKRCGTCEACSEASGRCEPVKGQDDPDGCAGELTCDGAGACLPRNGQTCRRDDECASRHCVDDVCCDRACEGACEACALPGNEGTCSFVEGAPARGACPGRGACALSCDGEHAECRPLAEGQDCGTTCDDAVLTMKSCDARGFCQSGTPTECAEHLTCGDAQTCRARCEGSSDCVSGFACESGACVELTAHCVDGVTAEGPSGREDCGPYTCASGKCRTRCRRATDCASGYVCNEKGECLAPEAAVGREPTDEGCSCRAARGSRPQAWLALGLVGLTLTVRRRRA